MTYTFTRPLMDAAELKQHQVDSYGRDYRVSDDGYGDMEAEEGKGWRAVAGDLVKSRGCVLRVLEAPHVSSQHDLFGRDMYVFRAEITAVSAEAPAGKAVGDSGNLVYGLTADVVMA